jgi:hypothetical protein
MSPIPVHLAVEDDLSEAVIRRLLLDTGREYVSDGGLIVNSVEVECSYRHKIAYTGDIASRQPRVELNTIPFAWGLRNYCGTVSEIVPRDTETWSAIA